VRRVFRDDSMDRRFDEAGYVIVPLLTAVEVTRLRQTFAIQHPETLPAFYNSMFRGVDESHRRAVYEAIREQFEPKIDALFDDYRPCVGLFLVKEPSQPESKVPMHVDPSFVDEHEYISVNIWCPLGDVDEVNGCLHVVPGSHRHNVLLRPINPTNPTGEHPFHQVIPLLLKKYTHKVEMAAGEAVIYNSRLLHGSGPNMSSQRRVAAGCVAVPREARLLYSIITPPMKAEIYEVDDTFFWRYQMGDAFTGAKLVGTAEHYVRQLTDEDVLESSYFGPAAICSEAERSITNR
jgi:hypothetical protein